MTIGDRIKQRRTELNMSQEELAQKIGYKDRSTISYIESGGKNFPISRIQQIADALWTTPEWLMGWEKDIAKEQLLQSIYDRHKILFDVAQDATEEEIKAAVDYINFLKGKR